MTLNKNLITGSTTMLILKLLEDKDMYGYLMIEELRKRSDNTLDLKAGTLYPLLHGLEEQGMLESYEESAGSKRVRKYYSITNKGRNMLVEKQSEWNTYTSTINGILDGGASLAIN